MATKAKANGSVDIVALAMRKVFSEAVDGGMEPVRRDIANVIGNTVPGAKTATGEIADTTDKKSNKKTVAAR